MSNPLMGTTTIVDVDSYRVRYKRGNSIITLAIDDIYKVFEIYAGKNVSSTDLRTYNPGLYDSKKGGHSCNCSFLFLILISSGFVSDIRGKGVKGDPFWVFINR